MNNDIKTKIKLALARIICIEEYDKYDLLVEYEDTIGSNSYIVNNQSYSLRGRAARISKTYIVYGWLDEDYVNISVYYTLVDKNGRELSTSAYYKTYTQYNGIKLRVEADDLALSIQSNLQNMPGINTAQNNAIVAFDNSDLALASSEYSWINETGTLNGLILSAGVATLNDSRTNSTYVSNDLKIRYSNYIPNTGYLRTIDSNTIKVYILPKQVSAQISFSGISFINNNALQTGSVQYSITNILDIEIEYELQITKANNWSKTNNIYSHNKNNDEDVEFNFALKGSSINLVKVETNISNKTNITDVLSLNSNTATYTISKTRTKNFSSFSISTLTFTIDSSSLKSLINI